MHKANKNTFQFADLFCGGGCGARGAVSAGGTPIVAVDAWNVATETYRANFKKAKVINALVEKVSPRQAVGRRRIDLLLSSPECTNHSHARGNREPVESSRETALSTLVWTKELTPKWIVMENVPNIRAWARYEELVDGLRRLGYGIRETVVCASRFGVPQRRRRLFLTAMRGDVPSAVVIPNQRISSAAEILDPTGIWNESPLYSDKRAVRTLKYAEAAIGALGTAESFLVVYYGSDKGGGWQSLDEPLRTVTTLDRFALIRPTVRGPVMRMLQPPELARAMGLPKFHRFPTGSRRDRIKLCGNGICAPVMRSVVSQLVNGTR